MNEKPFVSIIIPFYNTPPKAFDRCINSLLNQKNGNFEAIIINDGSAEEYDSLLKDVSGLDDRIKLINKKNEGSAVARNVGIEKAKGEYIMFLDSDDALTEICLENAIRIAVKTNSDLIMGCVKHVTVDEIDDFSEKKNVVKNVTIIDSDDKRNKLMSHLIGDYKQEYVLQNGYVADGPVAKLIKANIVKKTRFTKEAYWNDDTVWNIKVLKKCKRILVLDELWYLYLIYSDSKTRRYRPNCPYEFRYRTHQEIGLFRKYWPKCMKSIYIRVFNDIVILCRTFLFHANNTNSFYENYRVYKMCIHTKSYREALKGLNLKHEKRIVNRIGKELLRFTAYYGPNIISYLILKVFYEMKKDSL